MSSIKKAVLAACAAGLISTLVRSAAVGESGKRILKLIVNMMIVIALIKPLLGGDFSDLVDGLQVRELDSQAGSSEHSFDDYYIASAELSTRSEVEKTMREKGIDYSSVVITCEIDEYDLIVISRVKIIVNRKEEIAKAKAFTDEIFPTVAVEILSEDENESKRAENASEESNIG